MTLIVDRHDERARLASLLDDGAPRLVLLYGRRRVGKTYLLTHVWSAERAFYFTAAATTPEQNRRQLIADLADWSGEDVRAEDYPTWRAVFRLLFDFRSPDPLAIVLDEFQYLGEDSASLATVASELNAAWEQRRPRRALVVVLSGSAIGTLAALDQGAAPLHGRFDWKHQLQPFDYRDAAEMTPLRHVRDRARAYGVFGGTPRYLAAVKPRLSLAENVTQLMLAPSGEVRELVRTAIVQEQGLRDTPRYVAILRAIAAGRTDLNEIGQGAGLSEDTGLRDKIERLTTLGYVRPERNLGARQKAPFRYRLADPAHMFFYEFVARYETALERNDARELWRKHVEPAFDTYMGHVFERIAEQAYTRLRNRFDLPMVREWGRWEGRDRAGEPLEIDIACTLTDGGVMTGGVKWNARPLGAEWIQHHLRMLDRLADAGVTWAHIAREPESPLIFVAAGGWTPAFEQAARTAHRTVILWTLDDLYQ